MNFISSRKLGNVRPVVVMTIVKGSSAGFTPHYGLLSDINISSLIGLWFPVLHS